MRTASAIDQIALEAIGKNEAILDVDQAVIYLNSIGYPMSRGTLRNRLYLGTGPARVKVGRFNYFRKSDLDAWKKSESKSFAAYTK